MLLVVRVAVLIAPVTVVAVPAMRDLTKVGLLFASAIYLAISAAVSAVVFRVARNALLTRLGWLAAAFWAAAALGLVVWTPSVWRALEYGLIAGAVSALVIPAGARSVGLFYTHVWDPLRRRPLGELQPSIVVAVRLWFLLDAAEGIGGGWRRPKTRKEMLGGVWYAAFWLETTMRISVWMAGYRGRAYEDATQRLRQVAGYGRGLVWRVLDMRDQATFDGIRKEVAEIMLALACGNWMSCRPCRGAPVCPASLRWGDG